MRVCWKTVVQNCKALKCELLILLLVEIQKCANVMKRLDKKNREIKFIYFDVGGVAILDFSKTNKWKELTSALGVTEANRKEFDKLFDEYEPKICAGEDLDIFVRIAKSRFGLKLPKGYSMLDDLVSRFEANMSLQPVLAELSKKYKLGLLTNMYPGMLDKIKKRGILPDVQWKVVIDSSVVGFAKPQNEIYKIAEDKAGVNPENIFLIDNTAECIAAAKKRGWRTLLYDPADTSGSNNKLRAMCEPGFHHNP